MNTLATRRRSEGPAGLRLDAAEKRLARDLPLTRNARRFSSSLALAALVVGRQDPLISCESMKWLARAVFRLP